MDKFKKKYGLESLDKELKSLIISKVDQAFAEMMEQKGKHRAVRGHSQNM